MNDYSHFHLGSLPRLFLIAHFRDQIDYLFFQVEPIKLNSFLILILMYLIDFKAKDIPKKFMGVEIGDIEGSLDSTRSGVIYLSETVSKIKF